MLKSLGRYSKSISTFVATAVAWGWSVVNSPSQSITASEWMTLIGAVALFLLVLLVPNAAQSDPPVAPAAPPAEGV